MQVALNSGRLLQTRRSLMNRRFLIALSTSVLALAAVTAVLAQAPAPAAPAAAKGKAPQNPATPQDLADLAKLAALPAWTKGAGDGDYSIGPDYAPAPEETQRVGIPHGKLVEFHMNS